MKAFYVIGLTVYEAQSHAMRLKKEHRGHQVRILSAEQVGYGALRGLSGEGVEITVLPRVWQHPSAMSLGIELGVLEERGVRVITSINEGDEPA